jgi:ribonuclease HI
VRCGEEGWKRDEVIDALNVALIVGGSITIPHVRRAFARMREIDNLKDS